VCKDKQPPGRGRGARRKRQCGEGDRRRAGDTDCAPQGRRQEAPWGAVGRFGGDTGRMPTLGAGCSWSPLGLCRIPSVWANCEEMDGPTPSPSSLNESHSIDYINLILSLFWITTKATTKLRKDILTQAHCSPLFSQPPQSSSSTPRRHNLKAHPPTRLTHAQRQATTTTATSNERRARRHRGQRDRSHHEVGRYQRAFGVRNEPLPDLMRSPLTELNAADRSGTCSSFHDLGPS
jgi:hypothetical protein